MQKLFGIGMPKSGSYSLHQAFQQAGLRSLHDYASTQQLIRAMKEKSTCPLLDQYDTFLDGPFYTIADLLLKLSDEHHLIYHWRDVEQSINSALVHVLDHRLNRPENPWLEFSTDQFRQQWHAASEVFERLKSTHPDRVHELKAGDESQWRRMCQTLKLHYQPMPKLHTSRDRLKSISQHYGA